jgi:hypothetical protein
LKQACITIFKHPIIYLNNKNKMKKIVLSALTLSALAFSSCKDKHDGDDLVGTGTVTVEFDNRAGDESLDFNQPVMNAAGEELTFSTFKYYVSNFVLVKADGTTYTVPKDSCYFLVDQSIASSRSISLKNIPAGEYTRIKFMVGVDSLKNTADISERTGVLDPAGDAAGMYWDWNSGYIHLKIEGTSPSVPYDSMMGMMDMFMYHVGGFGGYNSPSVNNTRTLDLTIPNGEVAEVGQDHNPTVHMMVDILEALKTPTTISVATTSMIHMPNAGATIANNYMDMFKIDHVHSH